MSTTGNPALDRVIRSILQFIVGSGFTAVVNMIVGGLSPTWAPIVLMISTVVVSLAQNLLEDAGTVPVILKGSSEAEFAQQLGVPKDLDAPKMSELVQQVPPGVFPKP